MNDYPGEITRHLHTLDVLVACNVPAQVSIHGASARQRYLLLLHMP